LGDRTRNSVQVMTKYKKLGQVFSYEDPIYDYRYAVRTNPVIHQILDEVFGLDDFPEIFRESYLPEDYALKKHSDRGPNKTSMSRQEAVVAFGGPSVW